MSSDRSLREKYEAQGLRQEDVSPDPLGQFAAWFAAATNDNLPQVDAMTLATATPDGRPSARMVLLIGFDERGFVFYTHYQSRKGEELARNPYAALAFWWYEHHRQVRIEGVVSPIAPAESDAYFRTRPRGSQIGAWVSAQSQPIRGRDDLETQAQVLVGQFLEQDIPRPPFWGGFRLQPHLFEFWQGQTNRLHDRLCYILNDQGQWVLTRLAP
jgi:pyridoxamine 5'-phosphate oxidase